MSGKIRSQLGPVKKRVRDRIAESKILMMEGDMKDLKDFRVKFETNIATLDRLMNSLNTTMDPDEEGKKAAEATLEECAELMMDASELSAAMEVRLCIYLCY